MDWRQMLSTLAQFLGRQKEAGIWLRSYEERTRSAKEQIAQAIGKDSVMVLRIYKKGIFHYGNRGIDNALFRDLQLPAAYLEQPANAPIALERLGEIAPDRILVAVCQEDASRVLAGASALCRMETAEGGKNRAGVSDSGRSLV